MKYWLVFLLAGCTAQSLPHRPAAQSWDQEQLKQNDHGCPSAVFIAPGGELQQCGVSLQPYSEGTCWHDPHFGGRDMCQMEAQL